MNLNTILVILPFVPYPLIRGNYQRAFFMIRELAKSHQIDLICLDTDRQRKDGALSQLKKICRRIHIIPFKHPKWAPFCWRLMDRIPASIHHWRQSHVLAEMQEFVKREPYDCVYFLDLILWQYAKVLAPHALKIMDRTRVDLKEQKLLYQEMPHTWSAMLSGLEGLLKMGFYEKQAIRQLDATIVTSEEDKRFIKHEISGQAVVKIIQNGVDERFFDRSKFSPERAQNPTLIFCGTLDQTANIEGLKWYFREIDPLVKNKYPSRHIWIVGLNPTEEIKSFLSISGVFIHANVPDVRPYYQQAWINIVPIRMAGKSRLKIVESLCIGCPVISTSAGMEGLNHLKDKQDLLIADGAGSFAEKIDLLFADAIYREKIAEKGREAVLNHYTWSTLGASLSSWIEETLCIR